MFRSIFQSQGEEPTGRYRVEIISGEIIRLTDMVDSVFWVRGLMFLVSGALVAVFAALTM